VDAALGGLGLDVQPGAAGLIIPSLAWGFALAIEADLLEEVLRIVGFDAAHESPKLLPQRFPRRREARLDERVVLDTLVTRGYQECINYAFVDPALQEKLFPGQTAIRLANPIASDLAVMRVSLWPALLKAALTNLARQQDRVRLFEQGAVFHADGATVREVPRLAGLIVGPRYPEQWAAGREAADFFDLKGDVSALLQLAGSGARFEWQPAKRSCLHPGRGGPSGMLSVDLNSAGFTPASGVSVDCFSFTGGGVGFAGSGLANSVGFDGSTWTGGGLGVGAVCGATKYGCGVT
jgi:phenylalanyl-tRNA synthetase beta chain